MSKIKALAGETVLYGLGNILPRTINFFLVSLQTRIFLPDAFGVFTYISAFVACFNVIYTFGLETAFFRFATAPGADPKKVFDRIQTLVVTIGISVSAVLIAFARPIAGLLKVEDHPEFIVWTVLIMLVDAIVSIPFARLRLEKRPTKYATARLINIASIVLLNIYFLKISYDPAIGIGYIFLANLISNGLYLLFFGKELVQWRPSFDSKIAGTILRYSWPIMLGGLAWAINEMFSRAMLEFWLPKDFYGPDSRASAVGVFGACYKYSVLMNLAVQAFRFAAEPFFFSNASDKKSPELFARVNHYFVIVCCFILVGVSINMDVLKHIVGDEFQAGVSIVPLLLLAYLFLGLYYNFSVWYKLSDRTYFGTLIFCGGALLTVLLNYILIPIAGYTGSSWATLIVYFVMAAACYMLGQKYYPIPYTLISDGTYILISVAVIAGLSFITIENVWVSFGLHALVLAALALITWRLEKKEALQGH